MVGSYKSIDNKIFGLSFGGQRAIPYEKTEVDTHITAAYCYKVLI